MMVTDWVAWVVVGVFVIGAACLGYYVHKKGDF